jgi:FkbM family methyltransferase
MAWCAENRDGLYATWLTLADQTSRDLFVRLLLFRLLGHLHVRIKDDVRWSSDAAMLQTVEAWRQGSSSLPLKGDFGGIDHFEDVTHGDHRLALDCWPGGLVALVLKRQYYLERPGVRVRPEAGDVVIDAGAFVGETAVAFAADVGPEGRVFAFDPLPDHLAAIEHNARQNGFQDRVTAVPWALSNTVSEARPASQVAGLDPGFSVFGKEAALPLMTVDHFMERHGLQRLDFLKMDIEGAELSALVGARQTLVRHRPKLAISLYHRRDDFVAIPQFLAGLLPGYRFYLDHYTIHAEETVLYGSPGA